jgi:hypothetical protein
VSSGPPGFSRQEVLFIALHTKIMKSQRSSINTPSTKTNTEVFKMTTKYTLENLFNMPSPTDDELRAANEKFRAAHPDTDWVEVERQHAEILQNIRDRMKTQQLKRQERLRDFGDVLGNEHK